MKKTIKSIYIIGVLILLATIMLFHIENNYRIVVAIVIMGAILFGTLVYYKKKKDNNFYRWSATKIVVIVLVCYYVLVSILGIYLGFNKTFFSLNIKKIFEGAIPVLIITLIAEYLKFVLIKNNFTNKLAVNIITILMILFNITINCNINTLTDGYKIFIFICTIVIPIIAQELLTTYMALNYGFLPIIAYKLIMNLYLYLIPISANLGDYLYGVINILIPFTTYLMLRKYLNIDKKEENNKRIEQKISLGIVSIPITFFLLIIIILVSGISKYQMIAIATNSMFPEYQRGDAVIFEKIDATSIKVGDIIVFRNKNRIVTHRVVKIKENANKLYFYTKGDANDSVDSEVAQQEDILGIVRKVVKYIGYPTVKINEILGGNI